MKLNLSLLAGLALAASAAAAETTRTERGELSAGAPFTVENLVGSMRVVPGSGPSVVAVATVHAEDPEKAALLKFEKVTDRRGRATLRLSYPVDRYRSYRDPRADGRRRHSTLDYQDARVRVGEEDGILLYADLEVQVPPGSDAALRNRLGPIQARGLRGTVLLDTGSGDVELADSEGDLRADTGSGDVSATRLSGRFICDSGSGECAVTRFQGERLSCDTGSGDIVVRESQARTVKLDTGSGAIRAAGLDAEELEADTGSGNVEVQADGARLRRVQADTGSGNVRLAFAGDAGFEARADLGSGRVISRFADAEPIRRRDEIVGYRRGDGRLRIDVETGSGNLVLEPRP